MNAPLDQAVVLEATNLARTYEVRGGPFAPTARVHALAEASFRLQAGKTLAVVGESGCGKSTLARLVTMIEEPTGGALIVDGEPVTSIRGIGKALRRKVQIVFQDPYGSLNPRQKVGAILEEPLKVNTGDNASVRRERALAMMARVGLRTEHYDRYPHMFSGGQRQRIAIARALMLDPKILVLDEPVSALDVSIQAQVLNLLMDLQTEFGLAYLFISHDLSVVRHLADDVMVMYLGRAVEVGTRDQIFDNPRHPYTRALLSATPTTDPALRRERIRLTGELPSPLRPPPGCAFHPRCPYRYEPCDKERPPLVDTGSDRPTACHGVHEGII
jgi:dipeptide transport system ATP-binding protein